MFSGSKRPEVLSVKDSCQLTRWPWAWGYCILAEGLKVQTVPGPSPQTSDAPLPTGWLKTAINVSSHSSGGQNSKIMVSRAVRPPEA